MCARELKTRALLLFHTNRPSCQSRVYYDFAIALPAEAFRGETSARQPKRCCGARRQLVSVSDILFVDFQAIPEAHGRESLIFRQSAWL